MLAGPEVAAEGVKVLQAVQEASKGNFNIELANHDFGGIAIDNHQNPLPDSTLEACRKADAILLGRRYTSLMYATADSQCRRCRRTQMGGGESPT